MQTFDVRTWPQSLDLTPVEHVWAMKHKLNAYLPLAKGMLQLWERVQVSYHSITLE